MSPRHYTAVFAAPLAFLVGCGGLEQGSSDASASPDANLGYDASVCANTQTDPHNCGTCGHDCLGGSCTAGMCQPVVLVTVPAGISSFTIDANNVYWTWSPLTLIGTVSKCAIAGCNNSPTTLATNQNVPQNIYVAGPSLYWTNYNGPTIMTCSTQCNDDAVEFIHWAQIESRVGYVANASRVFVTSGAFSSTGAIFACPASGCPSPATLETTQHAPTEIVTDGTSLYWLNLGAIVGGKAAHFVDGGVAKSDISGANPTSIATGYDYPKGLNVDATNVYWAAGDTLFACSLAGCGKSPATIVSIPNDTLWGVVVDQTGVYFGVTTAYPGQQWQIMKCPLPSQGACTTPTAVTQQSDAYPFGEIAADSKRIYWVSNDATQILMLAK